jgi:branched-chain amino acid transport system substrate-binding protein
MRIAKTLSLTLLAAITAAILMWWILRPIPTIPVGMVAWMGSGAVVGSSEMHAADLFREEFPDSPIRVLPVDDEWDPRRTPGVIQEALDQGVRFFVSTHPSKCAVASMHLFADDRALMINMASTSPALTGRDDFLLRIIPDAVWEQQAIARLVDGLPGSRILVLQDESNRPYTDPAFAAFAAEVTARGRWRISHHTLQVSDFKPDEIRALMVEPYDALYILAGTFQTGIGHLAQLFHHLHPDAPILLTPWSRSPAILEIAGDAIDRIILASIYPSRHTDALLDDYFSRFSDRFGYAPHAMTIGVRQALELLDQAFAQGHDTPAAVKSWLLASPLHQTSLGPIRFDATGDVGGTLHVIRELRQELQQ